MPLIKGSQIDTSSKLSYIFQLSKWRSKGLLNRVNCQSSGFFLSFQIGVVITFSVFRNLRLMDNLVSSRTILWVFPSLLTVSSGVFVQSCCDLLTCWINKLFSPFLSLLSLSLNSPFNLSGAIEWIHTYYCKIWCWIITLPSLYWWYNLFPPTFITNSADK